MQKSPDSALTCIVSISANCGVISQNLSHFSCSFWPLCLTRTSSFCHNGMPAQFEKWQSDLVISLRGHHVTYTVKCDMWRTICDVRWRLYSCIARENAVVVMYGCMTTNVHLACIVTRMRAYNKSTRTVCCFCCSGRVATSLLDACNCVMMMYDDVCTGR